MGVVVDLQPYSVGVIFERDLKGSVALAKTVLQDASHLCAFCGRCGCIVVSQAGTTVTEVCVDLRRPAFVDCQVS